MIAPSIPSGDDRCEMGLAIVRLAEEQITDEQASQISQSVKAVDLGKQSGRNEFGVCYGELYRKFGITSYKLMPYRKFNDAMKFLTEWRQTLVGDSPF